jgi:nicotinate-nucleotide adenylyltransferase
VTERVIVFGGTFDPVHVGHLAIAEQSLEHTGMDAVWFVPANVPPLRAATAAPAETRLAMLRAATHGHRGFTVLDAELRRGGVSYTADTMRALHAMYPDNEFEILVGADAARSIGQWRGADALLAGERFLIVNRSGTPSIDSAELKKLGFDPQRTTMLEVTSPPVSASEVRRRVAAEQDITGMVPDAVAELISRQGLYRTVQPVHNSGG